LVWKDNLIVDDTIITFEGFLDLVFCFTKNFARS